MAPNSSIYDGSGFGETDKQAPMESPPVFIDSMNDDDDTATVLIGKMKMKVPRSTLPPHIKEGDWMSPESGEAVEPPGGDSDTDDIRNRLSSSDTGGDFGL